MPDEVLLERRGAVLVITISRPGARNALNLAVAQAIAAAADELDASAGLRAGVLTGAGGVFSAGMDLKALLRGEWPVIEGRGLCGITVAPPAKPLIGAVEGWALAGGLELLLACDLVVASRTARLGIPEVSRSLVATGGGVLLLPQRIPRAFAMEMALTGDPVDAGRGLAMGLVNRVTAEGAALGEAIALAQRIAANGPLAVAASKRVIREGPDWPRAQAWARQAEITDPVVRSAAAVEGARAFGATPSWGRAPQQGGASLRESQDQPILGSNLDYFESNYYDQG